MSSNNDVADWAQRHEDFPITTMQYVETKLAAMRTLVMSTAAQIAASDPTAGPVYHVQSCHVDRAVQKLFKDAPL
jgi:hypothetical protein